MTNPRRNHIRKLLSDKNRWQNGEQLEVLLRACKNGMHDLLDELVILPKGLLDKSLIRIFLAALKYLKDEDAGNWLERLSKTLLTTLPENTALVVEIGAIKILLDQVYYRSCKSHQKTVIAGSIVRKYYQLLSILARFSVSANDLNSFLSFFRRDSVLGETMTPTEEQHILRLLLLLEEVIRYQAGPRSFFSCHQQSGTLIAPTCPFPQSGYCVTFNLSLSSRGNSILTGGESSQAEATFDTVLFQMKDEQGRGVDCLARVIQRKLNTLEWRVWTGKNECQSAILLDERHLAALSDGNMEQVHTVWTTLSVVHFWKSGWMGADKIQCYVDGKLLSTSSLDYPGVETVVFQTGSRLQNLSSQTGQSSSLHMSLSMISVYREALGPSEIAASLTHLHKRSNTKADSWREKAIFTYHAGVCGLSHDGNQSLTPIISDLSGHARDAQIVGPHATLSICHRYFLADTIYSLGGLYVLFPLLGGDHLMTSLLSGERYLREEMFVAYLPGKLYAHVVRLMAKIIESSDIHRELLLPGRACQDFLPFLSYLLSLLSPSQISPDVIFAVANFVSSLKVTSESLFIRGLRDLMFDFRKWTRGTTFTVQATLLDLLEKQATENPYDHFKTILTLEEMLHSLNTIYSLDHFSGMEPATERSRHKGVFQTLQRSQVTELRRTLCRHENTAQATEYNVRTILQSLYHTPSQLDEDLTDILELLIELIKDAEALAFLLDSLDRNNLVPCCQVLLETRGGDVQLLVIKLLHSYWEASFAARHPFVLNPVMGFALGKAMKTSKSSSRSTKLTEDIYTALMSFMLGIPVLKTSSQSPKIVISRGSEVKVSGLLTTLLMVLEDAAVPMKRQAVGDLTLLMHGDRSHDLQRSAGHIQLPLPVDEEEEAVRNNRDAILGEPRWRILFFKLCQIQPGLKQQETSFDDVSPAEQLALTNAYMVIASTVLNHGIQQHKNGWHNVESLCLYMEPTNSQELAASSNQDWSILAGALKRMISEIHRKQLTPPSSSFVSAFRWENYLTVLQIIAERCFYGGDTSSPASNASQDSLGVRKTWLHASPSLLAMPTRPKRSRFRHVEISRLATWLWDYTFRRALSQASSLPSPTTEPDISALTGKPEKPAAGLFSGFSSFGFNPPSQTQTKSQPRSRQQNMAENEQCRGVVMCQPRPQHSLGDWQPMLEFIYSLLDVCIDDRYHTKLQFLELSVDGSTSSPGRDYPHSDEECFTMWGSGAASGKSSWACPNCKLISSASNVVCLCGEACPEDQRASLFGDRSTCLDFDGHRQADFVYETEVDVCCSLLSKAAEELLALGQCSHPSNQSQQRGSSKATNLAQLCWIFRKAFQTLEKAKETQWQFACLRLRELLSLSASRLAQEGITSFSQGSEAAYLQLMMDAKIERTASFVDGSSGAFRQALDKHSRSLVSKEREAQRGLEMVPQSTSATSRPRSGSGFPTTTRRGVYERSQGCRLLSKQLNDILARPGLWNDPYGPSESDTHFNWKLDLVECHNRTRPRLRRDFKHLGYDWARLSFAIEDEDPIMDGDSSLTLSDREWLDDDKDGAWALTQSLSMLGSVKPSSSFGSDIVMVESNSEQEGENSFREGLDKGIEHSETVTPRRRSDSSSPFSPEDRWDFVELTSVHTEEVVYSTEAELISLKGAVGGRLEITRHSIYFYGEAGGGRQSNADDGPNQKSAGKHRDVSEPPRNDSPQTLQSQIKQIRQKAMDKAAGDQLRVRCWKLHTLVDIFGRRYMLRHRALELFFSHKRSAFFSFASERVMTAVFSALVSTSNPKVPPETPHVRDMHHAPRFIASVNSGTGASMLLTPDKLVKRKNWTYQWQTRQISNFEYLMKINTAAGRTYSDLTQYPVFPWIISDYTSHEIDLSNAEVYRDLSKPVGALNPQRLQKFLERAEGLDDTVSGSGDIPWFLYGSHYSSPGAILFYLLRIQPFTDLAVRLQGGHFDHADRIFHSIRETWANCLSSPSDLKELIPEFFYCPDFLMNVNHLPLGERQNGLKVDNVALPPWAKSAAEFVRINREALESEYVSQHLHEWIDLIFGHKQRGPPAREAMNVFYYLTYEGGVDLDAITDPVMRKAAEVQIANFGQTPSQVFRSPHPRRYSPAEVFNPSASRPPRVVPRLIFRYPQPKAGATPLTSLPEKVVFIEFAASREPSTSLILAGLADGQLETFKYFSVLEPPGGSAGVLPFCIQAQRAFSSDDRGPTLKWNNSKFCPLTSRQLESDVGKSVVVLRPSHRLHTGISRHGSQLSDYVNGSAALDPIQGPLLAYIDYAERTLKVQTMSVTASPDLKYSLTVGQSCPAVIAVSEDCELVACGHRDGTITLWHRARIREAFRRLRARESMDGASAKTVFGSLLSSKAEPSRRLKDEEDSSYLIFPYRVLFGHLEALCCLAISVENDLIVSGSVNNTCVLHCLQKARYLRTLELPKGVIRLESVTITRQSHVIVQYVGTDKQYHMVLYTVNGMYLASQHAPSATLSDTLVSSNGRFLVTATRAEIILRKSTTLEVLSIIEASPPSPICRLSLSQDERSVVAGLENGALIAYSLDLNAWRLC